MSSTRGSSGRLALLAASVIVAANMAVAWWVVASASRFVGRDLVPPAGDQAGSTATSRVLSRLEAATAGPQERPIHSNTHLLLHKLVEADVHLRGVANKQSIIVVAMTAAFSLLAVGFALFVMGAEGAFELSVGQAEAAADPGSLVFKATAPGLLCFVLATAIVWVGTSYRTQVTFGAATVVGDTRDVEAGSEPVVLKEGPKTPSMETGDGQQ